MWTNWFMVWSLKYTKRPFKATKCVRGQIRIQMHKWSFHEPWITIDGWDPIVFVSSANIEGYYALQHECCSGGSCCSASNQTLTSTIFCFWLFWGCLELILHFKPCEGVFGCVHVVCWWHFTMWIIKIGTVVRVFHHNKFPLMCEVQRVL